MFIHWSPILISYKEDGRSMYELELTVVKCFKYIYLVQEGINFFPHLSEWRQKVRRVLKWSLVHCCHVKFSVNFVKWRMSRKNAWWVQRPAEHEPWPRQLRAEHRAAARDGGQAAAPGNSFFSQFFFVIFSLFFFQRLRCSSSSWWPRSRGSSISSSRSTSITRWPQSTTDSGGQFQSSSYFIYKHLLRDCCLTREFIAKSSSDTKRIMLMGRHFSQMGEELRDWDFPKKL